MAALSKDEGVQALDHFFDGFHDAVTEGVRDYYRNYGSWAAIHRLTTRRSIIRDHIVHRLRSDVGEKPGVEVIGKHGTTLFGLVSQFLMKAHLLDKNMSIALNQTQHSMNFNENDGAHPALPAPGFSGTSSLYLGCIPNANDPLEPQVFLVCPAGAEPAWHIELKRNQGAVVAEIPAATDDLDREQLVEIPTDIERKKGSE
ncbi:MAG TPA: hypothetical protein VKQ29_07790 [Aliidongia sp.]|nr:hypothetical protein [Aliidongia sp.]